MEQYQMLRIAKLDVRRSSEYWNEFGVVDWNEQSLRLILTLAGLVYTLRGGYDE